MADKEDGEENASRGNEWEVVSLPASAYAAAPGSKEVDSSHNNHDKLDGENEAEASSAMFMSDHFIFPPSQHENLPLEPGQSKIHRDKGGEYDFSQLVAEDGVKSIVKNEEILRIKGLISHEFPGIQIFDEKGNRLSTSDINFEKDAIFTEEKSILSAAEFHSFHSKATADEFSIVDEGEGIDGTLAPQDHESDSGSSNFQKPIEVEKYEDGDLPCEAWWKRRVVSLYFHAKEANTYWSILIAAAVMGLVIIGHQWQQERWQVLRLKRQLGITDERLGRMLGPIYRLKDVIVGGHRRGSLVRGSTSIER